MTSADLRRLVESTPFSPFRLHLADGRALQVPHPDYIKLFFRSPRVVVEKDDGTYYLVNLPIVTSVEVLSRDASRPA